MSGKNSCLTAAVLVCFSSSVLARAPAIIAHRGGTGDGPENTEYVIQKSLDNKADAIWVTLQMTSDNVIVLYRPSDLATLTDLSGTVSSYTVDKLKNADAAYKWQPPTYPLRGKGIAIPELKTVLQKWPKTFFYLDIKSPDASPQQFADVLLKTLDSTHALNRVRVYSTENKYLEALPKEIPRFESRDTTRTMLANVTMNHQCSIDAKENQNKWYGFEFKRKVQVIEKFTLGEGVSDATLQWDKEAFSCFKKGSKDSVVLFGINSKEDYQQAKALGADGVLVDSPEMFRKLR